MRPKANGNSEIAISAYFDAFRTIARVTFVEEMLEMCELAEQQVNNHGRPSSFAKELILGPPCNSTAGGAFIQVVRPTGNTK
jgi:hypothetical protein